VKNSDTLEAPASTTSSEWAPPVLTPTSPDVTLIGANETSTDRGLSLLLYAIRVRELSLIDLPLLQEAAVDLARLTRAEVAAVRFDPTVFDDMRTFVQNVDIGAVVSAPARAIGRLFTRRPHQRPAASDPSSYPTHVKKIRITPVAAAPAKVRRPRSPTRWVGRVRFGRVVTRGVLGAVLFTTVLTMPADVAAKLATEATSIGGTVATEVASVAGTVANEVIATIGTIATEVTSAIGEKLAAAQRGPALAPASFEVPPLSAYGAAFESQAPYPTARPNAQVEWVIALRNTGSAGWYRGIEGAQASVALADGKEVAVQTTPYVGPGQVGWFVVHFAAPSQPGVTKVVLLPRIDGRGSLPDLGLYVTVTVSPNP
jgi:hypothetical protein